MTWMVNGMVKKVIALTQIFSITIILAWQFFLCCIAMTLQYETMKIGSVCKLMNVSLFNSFSAKQ